MLLLHCPRVKVRKPYSIDPKRGSIAEKASSDIIKRTDDVDFQPVNLLAERTEAEAKASVATEDTQLNADWWSSFDY